MSELKAREDFSRYNYISLETDAIGNDATNRFCEKNGFARKQMFVTDEGCIMYEYCYSRG